MEGNSRASVGRQLADARRDLGLTQMELAERAGVDRANIAKIESGRYNVSVDILSRICNAMDCEIRIVACDNIQKK